MPFQVGVFPWLERRALVTIGPAQRSSLAVSVLQLEGPALVTSVVGVLQSRPVSYVKRGMLAALLLAVPLLTTGVDPALAQGVISPASANPLAAPVEAAVTNEAANSPAPGAMPPDAQLAVEVIPPEATPVADGSADPAAPADMTAGLATPLATPTSYVVQPRDTLFSIARRHGVTVDALLWANGLTDGNVLKEGQNLAIPPSSGTLYSARDGDTLESVAKANGVSVTGIVAVNGLAEGGSLTPGQSLLIPAPRQAGAPDPAFSPVSVSAAQVSAPVPVPSASATASPSASTSLSPSATAAPSATPAAAATPAPTGSSASSGPSASLVSSAAPLVKPTGSPSASPSGTPSVTVTTRKLPKLEWPLALAPPKIGITTRFQPGHTGIDIGAPEGTPIKAMAAGVVKRAEKGENGGYGWLVVVDHGEGVTTWYAHLSEISVAVGDKIQTGQKIGAAGATGRSTGPHLHFEVRVGNTPLDPLIALPK